MKAFLVKQKDNTFVDTVVRANDADDAKTLVADIAGGELGEIRSDVADSMGVPDGRGRHNGTLSRWIVGPTTIFGDLIK